MTATVIETEMESVVLGETRIGHDVLHLLETRTPPAEVLPTPTPMYPHRAAHGPEAVVRSGTDDARDLRLRAAQLGETVRDGLRLDDIRRAERMIGDRTGMMTDEMPVLTDRQ
jgi:hypothetical protein